MTALNYEHAETRAARIPGRCEGPRGGVVRDVSSEAPGRWGGRPRGKPRGFSHYGHPIAGISGDGASPPSRFRAAL